MSMSILKRFLIILLAILTSAPCPATELSYRLEKSVNSHWEHSYTVNHTIGGQHQAYLNTKAVFLAPRSDPFRANHEYFGVDIGGKATMFTLDFHLGTGSRYMWAGNSAGLPEGYVDWNNYISISKEI